MTYHRVAAKYERIRCAIIRQRNRVIYLLESRVTFENWKYLILGISRTAAFQLRHDFNTFSISSNNFHRVTDERYFLSDSHHSSEWRRVYCPVIYDSDSRTKFQSRRSESVKLAQRNGIYMNWLLPARNPITLSKIVWWIVDTERTKNSKLICF